MHKYELSDNIHLGEAEAIVLAKEISADYLVIDDAIAKQVALSLLNIPVIGTLRILITAKEKGYIKEIKPLILRMKENGLYLSDSIVNDALKLANEL